MPVIDRMDDAGKAVGFFVDNLHLEDLNPINCGWHQRDSLRRFGPGIRDHYILHYVLSGKGTFTCGGRTYPLEASGLFLIRKSSLSGRGNGYATRPTRKLPGPMPGSGLKAGRQSLCWKRRGLWEKPVPRCFRRRGRVSSVSVKATRTGPFRLYGFAGISIRYSQSWKSKAPPCIRRGVPPRFTRIARRNTCRPIMIVQSLWRGWPVCSASTGGIFPACLPGRPA